MKLLKRKTIIISIIVYIFVFYKIISWPISSTDPLPNPPDWHNLQGVYSISKEDGNFMINYMLHGKNYLYTVGKSDVSLEPYMGNPIYALGILPKDSFERGKPIHIIGTFPKNSFDMSTQDQCIVNKCHKAYTVLLGGNVPFQGINIKEVTSL